jgi:CheY-like chemotaxis protein
MYDRKPVIVCIDDEIIILESLRRQLFNSVGSIFNIEVASDGSEGLELIQQLVHEGKPIALVITDYIMPGPKIDELLAGIRTASPNTPTIVLSGQADRAAIDQARADGRLFGFLPKPWVTNTLLRTIREAAPAYFN